MNGFEATHTGNVIKYICRWKKKNGLEDLKKARWYLDRLIEKIEGQTHVESTADELEFLKNVNSGVNNPLMDVLNSRKSAMTFADTILKKEND